MELLVALNADVNSKNKVSPPGPVCKGVCLDEGMGLSRAGVRGERHAYTADDGPDNRGSVLVWRVTAPLGGTQWIRCGDGVSGGGEGGCQQQRQGNSPWPSV